MTELKTRHQNISKLTLEHGVKARVVVGDPTYAWPMNHPHQVIQEKMG